MSHKKLRPFIVKVSVLDYFPLLGTLINNQRAFITVLTLNLSNKYVFCTLIEYNIYILKCNNYLWS